MRALALLIMALLTVGVACRGGQASDPTVAGVGSPAVATPPTATQAAFSFPTVAPTPDISATQTASGCAMTPYSGRYPDGIDPSYTWETINWYSADGLWAQPDFFLGGGWYTGGMVVYWNQEFDGELNVSGKRLDGASQRSVTVLSQTFGNGVDVTMNLDIPEPGCWQITGTAGAHTLQFAVNVLPQRARPDVQELIRRHQALTPFAPPPTCAVTPIGDPSAHVTERSPFAQFEYALDGDGLSLRGTPDLLFEGENALAWFPEQWADVNIRGNLIGDAGLTLRSTGIRTADERGEYWRSTVLFPAPGCWELHATAGTQTLDAVVYVYPAECHPDDAGQLPAACATQEP
jgi:hypothetical protein